MYAQKFVILCSDFMALPNTIVLTFQIRDQFRSYFIKTILAITTLYITFGVAGYLSYGQCKDRYLHQKNWKLFRKFMWKYLQARRPMRLSLWICPLMMVSTLQFLLRYVSASGVLLNQLCFVPKSFERLWLPFPFSASSSHIPSCSSLLLLFWKRSWR